MFGGTSRNGFEETKGLRRGPQAADLSLTACMVHCCILSTSGVGSLGPGEPCPSLMVSSLPLLSVGLRTTGELVSPVPGSTGAAQLVCSLFPPLRVQVLARYDGEILE